jgi:hypothetical protein
MNWAWRDGKMSVEHYKHEHALDTETLAEAGKQTPPAAENDAERRPEDGPSYE